MNKNINSEPSFLYNDLADFFVNNYTDNMIIICIGTDKCIADSLGPLVGTLLSESHIKIPVYGTLKHPIHAVNLSQSLELIYKKHPNSKVLAIDACLGISGFVGEIFLRTTGIIPGRALGKNLPKVGDISIVGVVDTLDNPNIISMSGTRLNLVYTIAKIITKGILNGFDKTRKY